MTTTMDGTMGEREEITAQWVRTKADEYAVAQGCYFDLARAERVRQFFARFLCHSKGQWAGQPFELLDWQWSDVVAPLFGWVRPDGSRRFRIAYVELPKKNGKSTLASGIGLYLLAGDSESGAEVYSTASDQDQASIVHREAINMVESSPSLSKHLSINHTSRNIAYAKTRSYYRALSSEAGSKEGLNAHGIIVDELHAWYGRKLWDTLKYAGRSRRQPLRFVITTAGDDMLSVCREQHDYAVQVNRGDVKDARFFGYIRAADEGDNWKDPAVWRKANPSLGVTIQLDDFAADAAEAEKSPTSQAAFKRYSLNVWSTSTNPWLRLEDWAKGADAYNAESLAGLECLLGLDLSSTQDLTAALFVFRELGIYRLWPEFWMPRERAYAHDSPPEYRVWADQGLLHLTPGNVVDYEFVKKTIGTRGKQFKVRKMLYDPWNAEHITQEIEAEHGIPRVKFPQSIATFAAPTKEFERALLADELKHPNHPVLNWMAGNVQVYRDANSNMRPIKPKGGDRRKIDGIVAAIMGVGGWITSPPPVVSTYETRGMRTL